MRCRHIRGDGDGVERGGSSVRALEVNGEVEDGQIEGQHYIARGSRRKARRRWRKRRYRGGEDEHLTNKSQPHCHDQQRDDGAKRERCEHKAGGRTAIPSALIEGAPNVGSYLRLRACR